MSSLGRYPDLRLRKQPRRIDGGGSFVIDLVGPNGGWYRYIVGRYTYEVYDLITSLLNATVQGLEGYHRYLAKKERNKWHDIMNDKQLCWC